MLRQSLTSYAIPHLTEKIEVHLPLTFPCKDFYEKVNTTLEGLAVKDRLEGSPDFLEDQQDDDDDGDDDDEGMVMTNPRRARSPIELNIKKKSFIA